MKRIDGWLTGISDLTVVSLLLAVPLLIDMNTLYPTGPASKNLLLAYGSALALAFAGVHLFLTTRTISVRPAQAGLMLLGLYLLGRALFDPHADFALGTAAPHLGAIALALTISYRQKNRTQLRWHFAALTAATAISVVYALSQILHYDLIARLVYHREAMWFNPLFEEKRAVVFSTFGNPNYFAHFLGPIILLALAPALSARRWRTRIFWGGAAAVMLLVVLRTYNRGIWLGLMLGATVWGTCLLIRYTAGVKKHSFWRSCFRPRVLVIALILLTGVVAAMMWLPVFEPLVRRFRAGLLLRDTSVRSRLLFWLVALLMWRTHPWFGVGLGRYDTGFLDELLTLAQGPQGDMLRNLTPKMVSLRAVYVHSDYIQFLAEWGAVGFALFLLTVVMVLAAVIRVVRRDLHRPASIALPGVALCAAYASFLAQLAYDFPLNLPASELLFFFLVGVILVFEGESRSLRNRWIFSNRLICMALGLMLVVPWVWSVSRLPAKLSASHHLYHGQNNARENKNYIADREYETAARLDSENGEISFYRGITFAKMERIPQALDQYAVSVQTYKIPAYYYQLGVLHIARGDYGNGRRSLEKLIIINPTYQGANYALGLCHFLNPFGVDYSRAAEFFAREAEQYPDERDSLSAWLYLGESKWKLEDLSGARDAFRSAWRLNDRSVHANERLGDICDRSGGDPRVTLQYYTAAMEVADEMRNEQKAAELRNKINTIQRRLPR